MNDGNPRPQYSSISIQGTEVRSPSTIQVHEPGVVSSQPNIQPEPIPQQDPDIHQIRSMLKQDIDSHRTQYRIAEGGTYHS